MSGRIMRRKLLLLAVASFTLLMTQPSPDGVARANQGIYAPNFVCEPSFLTLGHQGTGAVDVSVTWQGPLDTQPEYLYIRIVVINQHGQAIQIEGSSASEVSVETGTLYPGGWVNETVLIDLTPDATRTTYIFTIEIRNNNTGEVYVQGIGFSVFADVSAVLTSIPIPGFPWPAALIGLVTAVGLKVKRRHRN